MDMDPELALGFGHLVLHGSVHVLMGDLEVDNPCIFDGKSPVIYRGWFIHIGSTLESLIGRCATGKAIIQAPNLWRGIF